MKISKDSSARYYKKIKEKIKKESNENIKIFPKKKKKKNNNMGVNNPKISLNMKSKNQLFIGQDTMKN